MRSAAPGQHPGRGWRTDRFAAAVGDEVGAGGDEPRVAGSMPAAASPPRPSGPAGRAHARSPRPRRATGRPSFRRRRIEHRDRPLGDRGLHLPAPRPRIRRPEIAALDRSPAGGADRVFVGIAMRPMDEELIAHAGRVWQAIHERQDREAREARGRAEGRQAAAPLATQPASAPVAAAISPLAHAWSSTSGTNERDAATIASATSGASVVPPRRLTDPARLMTGRKPELHQARVAEDGSTGRWRSARAVDRAAPNSVGSVGLGAIGLDGGFGRQFAQLRSPARLPVPVAERSVTEVLRIRLRLGPRARLRPSVVGSRIVRDSRSRYSSAALTCGRIAVRSASSMSPASSPAPAVRRDALLRSATWPMAQPR